MLEDNWSKKSASASSVNFEVVAVEVVVAVAAVVVVVVVDLVSPPSESESESDSLELEESELEELELDESLLGDVVDASSFSCSFWSFKAAICAARSVALESKNPDITHNSYLLLVQSLPWWYTECINYNLH